MLYLYHCPYVHFQYIYFYFQSLFFSVISRKASTCASVVNSNTSSVTVQGDQSFQNCLACSTEVINPEVLLIQQSMPLIFYIRYFESRLQDLIQTIVEL